MWRCSHMVRAILVDPGARAPANLPQNMSLSTLLKTTSLPMFELLGPEVAGSSWSLKLHCSVDSRVFAFSPKIMFQTYSRNLKRTSQNFTVQWLVNLGLGVCSFSHFCWCLRTHFFCTKPPHPRTNIFATIIFPLFGSHSPAYRTRIVMFKIMSCALPSRPIIRELVLQMR